MYQEMSMAWRASASTPPAPEVSGGGGGIMEGDTEEAAAAVPLEPGKGIPPPPKLSREEERVR